MQRAAVAGPDDANRERDAHHRHRDCGGRSPATGRISGSHGG
jgi:hypothetical protein